MPQRDYFMRLLEQAIEATLRAAKLRQGGQYEESLHSVIFSMEKLFGLTIRDLSQQSADQIFVQLTEGESPIDARNKCLVFAALNQQAGLTYAEQDLTALAQAAFYLALVFTLRALIAFPRTDLPAVAPKIDELLNLLDGFELPEDTAALLQSYRASLP
jgi:hypothetical protein